MYSPFYYYLKNYTSLTMESKNITKNILQTMTSTRSTNAGSTDTVTKENTQIKTEATTLASAIPLPIPMPPATSTTLPATLTTLPVTSTTLPATLTTLPAISTTKISRKRPIAQSTTVSDPTIVELMNSTSQTTSSSRRPTLPGRTFIPTRQMPPKTASTLPQTSSNTAHTTAITISTSTTQTTIPAVTTKTVNTTTPNPGPSTMPVGSIPTPPMSPQTMPSTRMPYRPMSVGYPHHTYRTPELSVRYRQPPPPRMVSPIMPGQRPLYFPRPPIHVPPPPPPPKALTDEEIVKFYEKRIKVEPEKASEPKLSEIYKKMADCCSAMEKIHAKRVHLNTVMLSNPPEHEWKFLIADTRNDVEAINRYLDELTASDMVVIKKRYFGRMNKKVRRKKARLERKKEWERIKKEKQEQSRRISEKMQKIKDEIDRAKQEEIEKKEADIVLRDVLRKKHDAKKCLVKLEALVKLRTARQNTFKGRGEITSKPDKEHFDIEIDKLKSVWTEKLSKYETEETELRDKLKQESTLLPPVDSTNKIEQNLEEWKEALFGGDFPQVDFQGDINRFLDIRSKWDEYLNENGKALPIGWIIPPEKNTFCSFEEK